MPTHLWPFASAISVFLNYKGADKCACLGETWEASMAQRFSYLLDEIVNAEFQQYPFKHIYIDNFLREKDFAEIISSPEVALPSVSSDEALFDQLFARGYK